ncbi:hypothetical protein WJX74_007322 [Apatococcus lobatus]|uniref:Integral membrane bound transporter domain-containing protein n=1 Tax=Apatococcus lobatus TaxID=904363 RepID=A0AAW1Q8T8_9CHLO
MLRQQSVTHKLCSRAFQLPRTRLRGQQPSFLRGSKPCQLSNWGPSVLVNKNTDALRSCYSPRNKRLCAFLSQLNLSGCCTKTSLVGFLRTVTIALAIDARVPAIGVSNGPSAASGKGIGTAQGQLQVPSGPTDNLPSQHQFLQSRSKVPVKRIDKRFPWRPSVFDAFRKMLLGAGFQAGAQFAVGTIIIGCFFWYRQLRWRGNCLLSTIWVLVMLLLSQHNHMGGRMIAAAAILGCTWIGCLLGGSMLSLARFADNGHGYTAVLCVLASIGGLVTAAIRSSPEPLVGMAFGIFTNIIYGVTIILGQFIWPANAYWNYEISHLLLASCVAAGTAVASGSLILPTLAGDEFRTTMARTVRGLGFSLSGYATLILARDAEETQKDQMHGSAPTVSTLTHLISLSEEEEHEWAYLAQLQSQSDPAQDILKRPSALGTMKLGGPAACLRPPLQGSRLLLITASCEPAWLQKGPLLVPPWMGVIGALEKLVTRVAACESLLESKMQILNTANMLHMFRTDVMPTFRLSFAQLAACCARVADAIEYKGVLSEATWVAMYGEEWGAAHARLQEVMNTAIQGYWQRFQEEASLGVPAAVAPAIQIRSLAFLISLVRGVLEAMAGLEAALAAAMRKPGKAAAQPSSTKPTDLQPSNTKLTPSHPAAGADMDNPMSAVKVEALGQEDVHDVEAPSPKEQSFVDGNDAGAAESGKPVGGTITVPAKAPGSGGKQMRKKPPRPLQLLMYCIGFLKLPLMLVLGLPPLKRVFQVFLRACGGFTSKSKLLGIIRDREVQFGLKLWFCCATVLVGVIIIQQDYPKARQWSPYFGYITIPIIFEPRVEITISKGFLRVFGTAVGGIVGFLIMFQSVLATRAVPLAVIICVLDLLAGIASTSVFRVAVILTVLTLNSQILCQFQGCCDSHGTIHYYIQQIVAISIAVAFGIIVSQFVAPWYASQHALDLMSASLRATGRALTLQYTAFEQAARAGAEEAAPPTAGQVVLDDPTIIQKQVAAPLGAVQMLVLKEAVPWSFQRIGLLTQPPVVTNVLNVQLALLDRLAAFETVATLQPIGFEGFPSKAHWNIFMHPMLEDMRALCAAAARLTASAATVMQTGKLALAPELDAQIQEVDHLRVRLRSKYLEQRRQLHGHIREHGQADISPATLIRFQSWLFSIRSVLDMLTRVVRTITGSRSRRRNSRLSILGL